MERTRLDAQQKFVATNRDNFAAQGGLTGWRVDR